MEKEKKVNNILNIIIPLKLNKKGKQHHLKVIINKSSLTFIYVIQKANVQ